MLRVTTLYASTAAATAGYYTKYLTQAEGEVPGVWAGKQAARFGLVGSVDAERLERLLSGCDPNSGITLGNPLVDRTLADGRVVRAVSGFDATISAPKSLSAWWALTGDQRLLARTTLRSRRRSTPFSGTGQRPASVRTADACTPIRKD